MLARHASQKRPEAQINASLLFFHLLYSPSLPCSLQPYSSRTLLALNNHLHHMSLASVLGFAKAIEMSVALTCRVGVVDGRRYCVTGKHERRGGSTGTKEAQGGIPHQDPGWPILKADQPLSLVPIKSFPHRHDHPTFLPGNHHQRLDVIVHLWLLTGLSPRRWRSCPLLPSITISTT